MTKLAEILQDHHIQPAPTTRRFLRGEHLEILLRDGPDHTITVSFQADGPLAKELDSLPK